MKQYTILITDRREKVIFRDELDTWIIPSADIQITDNPIDGKSAVVTTWGIWLKSRKFIWVKWLAWTTIQIHSNVFKLGGMWWWGSSSGVYAGMSPTTITVGWLSAGTDITGWTYDQIHETELVSSVNPMAYVRSDTPFGLYEVWVIISNPLIEWRGTLWWWPAWMLTNLSISVVGFNQINPIPWTWYGVNDANVNVVLGNTVTYVVTVDDSEWRSVNASWSYVWVYPYYVWRVNEQSDIFDWITQAQILALWNMNNSIKSKSNTISTTSPTNWRYCIMYPAIHWPLSEIIDDSGIDDTILDYDVFTYDVVGLDWSSQAYLVYILGWDTTQIDFTNYYNH